MESLGGLTSFPSIEEVVTVLIFLCAALHCLKSQKGSPEAERFKGQLTPEQIIHLLQKKRLDPHFSHPAVRDDDIYSLEPWDLPRESDIGSEVQFCYFFNKPYYKYKKSNRAHRRTNEGYWKGTGKGSKIKARNGLTGFKKILTFYRHGLDSKKAKTEWVMHEFHIEDNPSYKKEFVLCRIERKWDNKHGISTPDESESSQQLDSQTQPLPGDHLISSGNHINENTCINPQLLPPNHNLISLPGNHIEQNTLTNPQLPPNHNLISYSRNHIEQITLTNQIVPPNHNMLSCPGNHIEQNTLSNTQLLPNHNIDFYPGNHIMQNNLSNPQLLPNHNLISCFGNHIEQNTNPQLVSYPNLISYSGNHIEENILSNPQLLSNHNLISFPRNHIEDNTFPELQLPPNSMSQLVPSQLSVKNNFAENNFQEENRELGEFNAWGGYNGLNYASFSTLQSPIYPEIELSYSNNSIDNCDFSNSQVDIVQVNNLTNLQRAFQDENSPEGDWTNPYP